MTAYLQNRRTGEVRILTKYQAQHPDMETISEDKARHILFGEELAADLAPKPKTVRKKRTAKKATEE